MNMIKCPHCGVELAVDKALEGQIEARVLAAQKHEHQGELAKLQAEQAAAIAKAATDAASLATRQLEGERQLLQQQAQADLELEKKRLLQDAANAQRKIGAEQAALIAQLKADKEHADQDNTVNRGELTKLMEQLRAERKAKENAELEAQKRLAASEDKIRQESSQAANERYHLRLLEQEKKLHDTQKALEDAQRKAAQGSQQNQGEVLELDLENQLRAEFPLDDIDEVKKGQRGADLTQTVKNQNLAACGILLWETKNGKWQPAWVPKFKQDIREANASIGVIVSQEIPAEYGDMKHLETNLWTVKPRLAPVLATALRGTILQVAAASQMNVGKDAKADAVYQFVTGTEFRHRVESIVENYGMLQAEIEKEKRAAALRWAHQEKSIRAVIDNTIGMYGDLQGITNRALPGIKTLELDSDEDAQPRLV